MAFLTGPPMSPDVSEFIEKVVFYLHSEYGPNNTITVDKSPFQITKHADLPYPIKLEVHFKDERNKCMSFVHTLKV